MCSNLFRDVLCGFWCGFVCVYVSSCVHFPCVLEFKIWYEFCLLLFILLFFHLILVWDSKFCFVDVCVCVLYLCFIYASCRTSFGFYMFCLSFYVFLNSLVFAVLFLFGLCVVALFIFLILSIELGLYGGSLVGIF